MNRHVIGLAVVGLLLGGLIGFMQRPSVFLVGQLPFSIVISRGMNLQGLDQLLIPAAQKSFNTMVTGGMVGAVIGGLVGWVASTQRVAGKRRFDVSEGGEHRS